jgi:DNA-binding NarL/FixJ family response regulator
MCMPMAPTTVPDLSAPAPPPLSKAQRNAIWSAIPPDATQADRAGVGSLPNRTDWAPAEAGHEVRMAGVSAKDGGGERNRMSISRPRVLLADDHTLLLEAFQRLLADECDVVGAVSDGRALIAATAKLKPDVIVVDVSMPLLNGLEAARQIKQSMPETRIVFLTMNEDPDLAAEAFRAGASAYLIKRSAASELLTAIREVVRNRSYVTPLVTEGLVESMLQTQKGHGPHVLTPRQREVIQLVAEGHSMKEVAAILNIAARTVAFHKYKLMEQLNIKTTAELIQYAIKHHII